MVKSLPYKPYYERSFIECLEVYKDKAERVLVLVERILADPKWQSHLLEERRGVDLRGKRRRHLGHNFVVVYIVCDECITQGFRDKGYNDCAFCTGEPLKQVVFLAFDRYDDIYSREWR